MQAAIQQCEKCHDVCARTVTHCLDQGNRQAGTKHITGVAGLHRVLRDLRELYAA